MEARDLKELVRFETNAAVRETLFESDRLFSQVVCLDRNQHIGPLSDAGSDAVFTVVAGEAVFLVDRKRRRLDQWATVLVPAGSDVTVTNASADPLVLLLVAAPPPAHE